MTDKAKSRLDKVLPKVVEWSTDSVLRAGKWMQGYLDGSETVGLASSDLHRYGMQAIRDSLLAAYQNEPLQARRHMSFGFSRVLFSEVIDILDIKKRGAGKYAIANLDGCAHTMLGAVALGRHDLAPPLLRVVCDGMSQGYGVRDGHKPSSDSTLRYGAFALTIICDWLNQPLDLDKFALPRDPAWGQLVAHWREPDLEKFLPIILTACDTHVERIAVTASEANTHSKKFEFGSVFLAVHPTEILAILRLRDLIGLPNPGRIDHPLMQTPYAQITCAPGAIKQRDDLLDDFLKVVRDRDPQALPSGM